MLVGLYSNRNGLFPAKETSKDKENVDYFSNVKKMKTFSTWVFTFFKSFFLALNLIRHDILLH